MKLLKNSLLIAFFALLTSCLTDKNDLDVNKINETYKIDKAYFSEILALSLENKEIRSIIKENSLKKFNNDYDVLIELVKNIKLTNGKTFLETISEYSSDPQKFREEVENSELLTVFVPELSNFSAETWDVSTTIPNVAVRIEEDISQNKPLISYSKTGNINELSYFIQPEQPTIVVKDNERVELISLDKENPNLEVLIHSKNGSLALTSSSFSTEESPNFENHLPKKRNSHQEHLSAPNSVKLPHGGPLPIGSGVPSDYFNKLTTGYNNYNFSYDRDWIYYNLKNDLDSGLYSNEYAEFIHGFYINNPITSNALDGLNDDWTEGQYEIVVKILFVENESVKEITKIFSISKNDLIKTTNGNTESYYYAIPPTEIASWDLKKYGDTWKFIISEFNQGQTKKYTVTTTSKFAANASTTFNVNIFGIIKFGANLGGSGETTKTKTHEINTTTTSYQLGEAIHTFKDPVLHNGKSVLGQYSAPEIVLHYIGAHDFITFPFTKALNTGLVTLDVVPLKRSGRPTTIEEYLDEAAYYYNNY